MLTESALQQEFAILEHALFVMEIKGTRARTCALQDTLVTSLQTLPSTTVIKSVKLMLSAMAAINHVLSTESVKEKIATAQLRAQSPLLEARPPAPLMRFATARQNAKVALLMMIATTACIALTELQTQMD
jgi:hypothetical protein